MHAYSQALSSTWLGTALLLAGCHGGDAASAGDSVISDAGDTATETVGGDSETTGGPTVCDVPSPYVGGWNIGCCQDEVAPQNGWALGGIGVGTIMPDWTLTDQFGEAVRLYDFCHDAIWFEYVALW